MTHKRTRVLDAQKETRAQALLATEVGWLVAGSTAACPRVDYVGNVQGPLTARTIVSLDEAAVQRAVASRQGVLLQFEHGHSELPIVTGLIQDRAAPLVEALLAERGETAAKNVTSPTKKRAEARLDGRRVVLEAEHEIELRCGDASLVLTRDGKVILRGAYVETRSRGLNRIKGAAVKIN